MEKYLQKIVEQQAKSIQLQEEQNNLLRCLLNAFLKQQIEPLISRLLDNADLKKVLKVADTKFFRVKKLFKTYDLGGKDYYLSDEILETIREHKSDQ